MRIRPRSRWLDSQCRSQVVTGTVGPLFSQSSINIGSLAGEVIFQLSTAAGATGCSASGYFGFSAASVADSQTRSNMTALLLAAKAGPTRIDAAVKGSPPAIRTPKIGIQGNFQLSVLPPPRNPIFRCVSWHSIAIL